MGDHQGRLIAVNACPFVGVDLNLWPPCSGRRHDSHIDVHIAVIVLKRTLYNQSINHILWSVGTIRSNRLCCCNLKSKKELKKVSRGAVESCVEKKSGIHVVRWLDCSDVKLSSTVQQWSPRLRFAAGIRSNTSMWFVWHADIPIQGGS